jgi:hypothetical protein
VGNCYIKKLIKNGFTCCRLVAWNHCGANPHILKIKLAPKFISVTSPKKYRYHVTKSNEHRTLTSPPDNPNRQIKPFKFQLINKLNFQNLKTQREKNKVTLTSNLCHSHGGIFTAKQILRRSFSTYNPSFRIENFILCMFFSHRLPLLSLTIASILNFNNYKLQSVTLEKGFRYF